MKEKFSNPETKLLVDTTENEIRVSGIRSSLEIEGINVPRKVIEFIINNERKSAHTANE